MGEFNGTTTSPSRTPFLQRIPNADTLCLSPEQAAHVYDCLDKDIPYNPQLTTEIPPNTFTYNYIMQGDDLDKQDTIGDNELYSYIMDTSDINVISDTETDNISPHARTVSQSAMDTPQLEKEWSILTDHISYPHAPRSPSDLVRCNACFDYDHDRLMTKVPHYLEAQNWVLANPLPPEYLNSFHPVTCSLNSTLVYNESKDVSCTYLGTEQIFLQDHFHGMCHIPFNSQGRTKGTVLGGTPIDILLDSGASRSFLAKEYYVRTPALHHYPKFQSDTKFIGVGSGQTVAAHFVIPLLVTIAGQSFEIFTLVGDIQNSIDLVLGVKNLFELEANMNFRTQQLAFFNRSLPIFPMYNCTIQPGSKQHVKAYIPKIVKLSGIAIVKLVHKGTVVTIRARIDNNLTILEIINLASEPISYHIEKSLGIIDIRSLGYYNVNFPDITCTLQPITPIPRHNTIINSVSKGHDTAKAKSPELHSMHSNTAHASTGNTLTCTTDPEKSKQNMDNSYPWLDDDDPRKFMSDEEILYKYIDLSEACLTEEQKNTLMGQIIMHKKAFSLRDEIGKCPEIRIDIELIDKEPFFVRPFPVAENDKPLMDKHMKKFVDLGILTVNSTTHTSPVMLIARKGNTQKRPVTDFRELNKRLLRRNTATLLMRDIINKLGRSYYLALI